jgi:hypothetical protein
MINRHTIMQGHSTIVTSLRLIDMDVSRTLIALIYTSLLQKIGLLEQPYSHTVLPNTPRQRWKIDIDVALGPGTRNRDF